MPLYSSDGITPYDPTAPTAAPSAAPTAPPVGGYATNSVSSSPAAAPTTQESLIFVGFGTVSTGPSREFALPAELERRYGADAHTKSKVPQFKTAAELLTGFDTLGRKDFLHFRNLLIAAGVVSDGADPLSVRSAYEQIISGVADMTARGIAMSPLGYIKNLARMNGVDPSKVGDSADFTLKPQDVLEPYTQTSKSVYDLSPEQARSTLEGAMTQLLGRAPSEAEIHDFINAAQTAARKHPTTATATFTPGDTGMEGKSSSTVSQGGTTTQTDATGTTVVTQHDGFSAADVSAMAGRRAKNAPDYAGYQAVATYFPALMSMLGATTGG